MKCEVGDDEYEVDEETGGIEAFIRAVTMSVSKGDTSVKADRCRTHCPEPHKGKECNYKKNTRIGAQKILVYMGGRLGLLRVRDRCCGSKEL
jgi:hypothetical protein